jgi:hypothetical protein
MHIAAKMAVDIPASNRRRAERQAVEVSTTLRASGHHGIDVVIRNISTLGFMADVSAEFEPGDQVRVRLPSLGTVAARVAWAREGQIGAEFETEIDLQRLRAVLAVTGAAPAKRERRPRLVS